MCSLFDDPHEQNARDCLLKYYNSKSVAHGSYILSIAIGFFAFIQAIPYIPEIYVSTIQINDMINISIFSIFITFCLYLFARTLYWGILSGYAFHVPPISYQVAHRRDPVATNLIHRLNLNCVATFSISHPVINWFAGGKRGKFFILRYVVVLAIVIALLILF